MSDFIILGLSVSTTVNMYLYIKLAELRIILRQTDNMLTAVAKGEAKIVGKSHPVKGTDWYVERIK